MLYRSINLSCCCSSDHYSIMIKIKSILAGLLLSILVPVDVGKYRKGGSVPSQNMVGGIVRRLVIVGMTWIKGFSFDWKIMLQEREGWGTKLIPALSVLAVTDTDVCFIIAFISSGRGYQITQSMSRRGNCWDMWRSPGQPVNYWWPVTVKTVSVVTLRILHNTGPFLYSGLSPYCYYQVYLIRHEPVI